MRNISVHFAECYNKKAPGSVSQVICPYVYLKYMWVEFALYKVHKIGKGIITLWISCRTIQRWLEYSSWK